MAKDAKGHGSEARGAADAARHKLNHAVTEYDRRQEAKAQKNPKAYYNHYALAQYLGAVDRVHTDMLQGKSAADAINTHLNGALARTAHKALGTGDTDIDTKRRESFTMK